MSNLNPKSLNKKILDMYAEKPIAFIPILAKISGSAGSGLFISQLLYWYGRGSRGNWIYKTFNNFHRETYLSRREQENAIAVWSKLGVLEKRVLGVPPTRHFRIDENALIQLLDKTFDIGVNDNSICSDEQNTITENTSENTLQRPVASRLDRKIIKI